MSAGTARTDARRELPQPWAVAWAVAAAATGAAALLRRARLTLRQSLVMLVPMTLCLAREPPELEADWGIDDRFARLESERQAGRPLRRAPRRVGDTWSGRFRLVEVPRESIDGRAPPALRQAEFQCLESGRRTGLREG